MTENEKKLRSWIGDITATDGEERTGFMLLDAALSSARDAALEEARQRVLSDPKEFNRDDHATSINALKSEPARRFVDVERAREEAKQVLRHSADRYWRLGAATLADALGANVDDLLGVDLDGAGTTTQTPREYATVENGLLPAPRKEGRDE
jgi:hypothetical protein